MGQSPKEVVFKSLEGREPMRVAKENRLLRAPVYHEMSPDGSELWTLIPKSSLLKEKWSMLPLCSLRSIF